MSQHDLVKKHLEDGKSITPIDALNLYGSFRLSAIIFNLRQSGMNINTEMVKREGKNPYGKYTLATHA